MLKKLKSLFIIEEEVRQVSPPVSSKNAGSVENVSNQSGIKPETLARTKKGTEKFVDLLLKALDRANQDGFDYMEFKDSIRSLGNVDLDEETRYKSAMAMAKTMGASQQSLLSSANYYLSLLTQEENKFNAAYNERLTKTKNDSKTKMDKLGSLIDEKKTKLKQLEEEIKKHEDEKLKIAGNISRNESKANQTKAEFDHAYNTITGQIKADLNKIEKYLK